MKIIQVVSGLGLEKSGVSHALLGLCCGLVQNQCEVDLHFAGVIPKRDFPCSFTRYPYFERFFPNLKFSRKMYNGLKDVCQDVDILHTNSFWMMPNVYPFWVAKKLPVKVVTSPHGCFAPWALKHGRFKKMIFGMLLQYPALKRTDMFHATCEKEYEEIRAQGYKQPVAIVPIGMDIPVLKPQNTQNTQKGAAAPQLEVQSSQFAVGDLNHDKSNGHSTANSQQLTQSNHLRQIVFFGRVHKVKAVDHLVKAWGALYANLPEWELVIAGPDCGAKAELEAIIAEANIPRVRFTGEIYGPAKYDFLREADIYVLPSHTENFGVTVAEALACGTPSIASQGTPWEGLETEKCGKWVPIGVEPLVTALRELTSLTDEERVAMGQRGIEWIRRDFSWEGIGAKMKAAYAWLLGQGEKPDFVKVD